MEFSELESFVFAVAAVWSVAALLLTCVVVAIAQRQIGRSLHVARGNRQMRYSVLLVCLFVLVAFLLIDEPLNPWAIIALGTALVTALLAPGIEDMALGEDGARHGWQARNWRQMEGWRLVGSHLRFLVHGELVAIEVPPTMMNELRAKLEALCPEGENRLGSAIERDLPVG